MKIVIAIILLGSMHVSAEGFSQNRISVNFQSVQLKKALSVIEKKSDYRFLYNESLVNGAPLITLAMTDAVVTDVLNRMLEQTSLSYQLMNSNLIVLKSSGTELQDVTVTGKVTSSPGGEALPGVSVSIKGAGAGTSTNATGNYSVTVPDNAVLVFSYVGYESQEIAVGGRTEINVTLQESTQVMDQVVVIGYGTAVKRDLTGSIAKVAGKEVADKPNPNPIASLQGKVAGLTVVNSGRAGQEPDVRIRGTISITQTKPLYVVDGLLNDNINFLNPGDIESIEVLKDPSSLAIFGVRGANGVIIVTTKRARTGQMIVNLNTSIGVKSVVDKIDLTNATDFRFLYDELRSNMGVAPFDYSKWQGNTDWVDGMLDNGIVNQNNISISAGTDKNKFYMGLGYMTEEGIIKYEKLEKILISINDEYKVSKSLKFGFNFNGYRAKLPQFHDLNSAINAVPIVEPYNEQYGLYSSLPSEIQGIQVANPWMMLEGRKNTDLSYEYRTIGSIFGEWSFHKDFTFRATFYGDFGFNTERQYTPIVERYNPEITTDPPIDKQTGFDRTRVYQKQNNFRKLQQDYLLTYKSRFGEHGVTAMAGFSTNFTSYEEVNGQVQQKIGGTPIPNDKRFWYLDNFFGDPTTRISGISPSIDVFGNPSPLEWEAATASVLFRILYNYQSKYLLNFSFRRDGSSDISPDNRWQNFIAVGAAWEMSKENFMESIEWVDFLKLKASWGVLGNQYTAVHYPFFPSLTSSQSAVFGDNIEPAYEPRYLPDPDLKWETVQSAEVGFELNSLKNRLYFEMNYYHKLTDGVLTNVPGIQGTKPGVTNLGKIQNKGFEFIATWSDNINKNLGYKISGNLTTLDNLVKELSTTGYEIFVGPSRTTAGYPIGYFYGYIHDGLFQTYADKLGSPKNTQFDYGPGDIKFRDVAGPLDANGKPTGPDGIVDNNDRVMIGNPTPDFTYGASVSLNYKGFDFGVDVMGVYGNEIFRAWGNFNSFAQFNFRSDKVQRWHGEGTSNWEPILNDVHAINKVNSTYMIEDGSYFRIRNVQLGYNFPSTMLNKIHVKSLRVFVNAQNLKTFKNNAGFVPEFGGGATSFGVDNGSYPVPAIYSFGINVSF